MVKRYFALVEHLDCRDIDLKDYIPTRSEDKKLEILYQKMVNFESLSKALQEEDLDLLSVRRLFDVLIQEYKKDAVGYYISADSSIITNKNFENGICKVIAGVDDYTNDELEELKCFEIEQVCFNIKIIIVECIIVSS